MSVPNIVPIVRYSGTGEQKEFYIPFPYLDKTDLVVRSSLNGAMSEADYEVNGKYITFINAPADKEVIAILRKTAIERIADYDDTGAVSASSLNDNFDRPLLSMQEIAEVLERCVKVDPTSYIDPQEYLEQNIKITENSKDVALNAAVSAANSAQTAATSERNIGLIWAEITGDPTLAENALITLKEAAEATGAITAAKELAIGEVRNTGAIAVAATEKAADEAREAAEAASNTAGSITKTVADEITIQVSQAAGATGVLGVAIETGKKVVEEARQEALDRAEEVLNNINSGNTSFNQNKNAALIEIQGKVDSVAIDVEKAVEKAQIIADSYLEDAKATVSGSLTDLEQMKQDASVAGDTELVKLIDKRIKELQDLQKNITDAETAAENALRYSNSANTASGNASSSASSAAIKAAEALKSAQDAATSASNAAASAVAASSKAEEASNRLLTLHNASTEAHPALMRGQITNPIALTSGADLNDFKTLGFFFTNSSSDAQKMSNCPTQEAFALEVYGDMNEEFWIIYQRLTEYGSAKIFVRRYSIWNEVWTEWKELATADKYLPLAGGTMTGNIKFSQNWAGINNSDGSSGFRMASANGVYPGLLQMGTDVSYININSSTSNTNHPGSIDIYVSDSNGHSSFYIYPDGRMTFNGASVLNPTGTVIAFAGNSAPAGYLICNGAAVSRTTYAGLFAVIGTTYGAGDGSSTFNLPNLTDKFIQGNGTAGTVKAAGLPNITGTTWGRNNGVTSGAFASGKTTADSFEGSVRNSVLTFDASRSNSIYGNSETVQPPAVTMRFYIKY